MVAPQKYRSVFTGQEIDEAIAAMRGTLSETSISNDWLGGATKVASAELAKILRTDLDAANTGANMRAKLMSIPNAKVLTDAEYARVQSLASTSAFRGVHATIAARDAALDPEKASYLGNEIAFVADDGSGDGLSEFSRWDVPSNSWKKVQLYNVGGTTPQLVAAAGAVNMFTYRTNRYTSMKVLVAAHNVGQTQRQIQEILLTHVGADTYISVYNEVGNVSNLFAASSSINVSTGIVTLIITTLSANVTISGKVLAMV